MKNKKFLSLLPILVAFAMPLYSFAAGIVPACDAWDCNFDRLLDLVNNVIKFILFDLAIPIAAIMFAYAGILLVTAGGGEAKTKAKGIFTNAVIGLALSAGAWLIIRTILSILGFDGAWIGF